MDVNQEIQEKPKRRTVIQAAKSTYYGIIAGAWLANFSELASEVLAPVSAAATYSGALAWIIGTFALAWILALLIKVMESFSFEELMNPSCIDKNSPWYVPNPFR